MAIKVAINGFGRIGRCTLRAIYEQGLQNEFDVVAINAAGERTAEGSSQTEQASRELSEHVSRLKQLISAFRVRGQA